MTAMTTFQPMWANPPGATIADLLEERGQPIRDFANSIDSSIASLSRLLFGVEPLTSDLAERLSSALGASPDFWLKREEMYRADLKRLVENTARNNTAHWFDSLPLKDMVRFGWIAEGGTQQETIFNACAFFGTTTPDEFERKYHRLLSTAAYRKSDAFETRPSAVAAWLRQGEIAAAAIDCAPWSSEMLRASLDDIRDLTRIKAPEDFLPSLETILSRCGVALVVARTPRGCRASGASRFLSADKASIQLSFRYLVDDQFWFTVFHEVGHLLLHSHDDLFLEGLENRNSDAEREANQFAEEYLLAKVGRDALNVVPLSNFGIARLARKAGIAPGIVVGQLQARGRVPYEHFNYLKVHYSWSD